MAMLRLLAKEMVSTTGHTCGIYNKLRHSIRIADECRMCAINKKRTASIHIGVPMGRCVNSALNVASLIYTVTVTYISSESILYQTA